MQELQDESYRGAKSWQTLDTSVVPENGNQYFTAARAIASTLSNYTAGAGTVGPSKDRRQFERKTLIPYDHHRRSDLWRCLRCCFHACLEIPRMQRIFNLYWKLRHCDCSHWTGASTLTTVGTISSGTWNAANIGVSYGGTGGSSFTTNGILYGSGSSPLSVTSAGSLYQVLQSGSEAHRTLEHSILKLPHFIVGEQQGGFTNSLSWQDS